MRLTFKRIITLVLAAVMVLSMASCNGGGDYFYKNNSSDFVYKYGDYSIPKNFYHYWLARYKAVLMYTYYDIEDTDAFWNKSYGDGTANDVYTAYAEETIKNYLVSLYLFDFYKLEFGNSAEQAIASQLAEIIADGYEGNVAKLNEEAYEFGINYKMLREIYIAEKKAEMIYDYMCANVLNSKLTDELREQYMRDNYAHTTHIFVSTEYAYNIDKDGNIIYDEEGNYTTKLTEEQKKEKQKVIEELDSVELNTINFNEYQKKYNDDVAIDKYKNGYYVSSNISFDTAYVSAALTMKEGEIKKVEGTNGVYYILKQEMPKAAYADKDNSDFFVDYDKSVLSYLYWEFKTDLYKDIETNDKNKEGLTIKSVAPCWYF